MPRARFETSTPASNRPQTLALDLSETAIGKTHRKSNTRPSGFSAVHKPTELQRARNIFQFRKTLISCLDVLSYKRIQIRSPDRPARNESLYRLSRPGPPTNHAVMGNYVINVAQKVISRVVFCKFSVCSAFHVITWHFNVIFFS